LHLFFYLGCDGMDETNKLNLLTDAEGHSLSPVLAPGIKNYLIDIDGTICDDVPNEDPERMKIVLPYLDALHVINQWYTEGHKIYFFTSRTESLRTITESWLNQHGFLYHGIVMGKPRGGNYHWIDNHLVCSTLFKGKFTAFKKEMKECDVFED
jgi:hypothetical protein